MDWELTPAQRRARVKAINEMLEFNEVTATMLGDPPEDFADAILSISLDPAQVIYSRQRVIQALMRNNLWEYDDAVEWYEYNIVRGALYQSNPPLFTEEV
jgi:hypothetical protein